MPDRIFEQIFAETRHEAADVLERMSKDAFVVTHAWRRTLSMLHLQPEALRVLASLDLQRGIERLRTVSYTGLQSRLKRLATELSATGVRADQALGAFYLLLEQCCAHMRFDPLQALALHRLAGIISGMITGGYAGQWKAHETALSGRLADARHRLHPASAYVTQIYEGERRRLSHDLHDEIGHDLMLLKLYLEVMLRDLFSVDTATVQLKLEQTLGVVQHAIDSARRLVLDLGPAIFDELGFLPALRAYSRQFIQRTGVDVVFQAGPMPEQIPMSHQIALYRVLQGALGNVFQHGHASRVDITLDSTPNGGITLVVQDDGVGFDLTTARKESSVGLIAMRERVEVLGGAFAIESTLPGTLKKEHGTRIHVQIPLPKTKVTRMYKRRRA